MTKDNLLSTETWGVLPYLAFHPVAFFFYTSRSSLHTMFASVTYSYHSMAILTRRTCYCSFHHCLVLLASATITNHAGITASHGSCRSYWVTDWLQTENNLGSRLYQFYLEHSFRDACFRVMRTILELGCSTLNVARQVNFELIMDIEHRKLSGSEQPNISWIREVDVQVWLDPPPPPPPHLSFQACSYQQVFQQQTTCSACNTSRIGPSGSQIRPRWRQALRVDAPPAVKMDVPHSSGGMAPRSEVQSQSPGQALLRESSQPDPTLSTCDVWGALERHGRVNNASCLSCLAWCFTSPVRPLRSTDPGVPSVALPHLYPLRRIYMLSLRRAVTCSALLSLLVKTSHTCNHFLQHTCNHE